MGKSFFENLANRFSFFHASTASDNLNAFPPMPEPLNTTEEKTPTKLSSQSVHQKVSISKPQMEHIDSIPDTDVTFRMGFATKPGLPIPHFPISHSAVCFQNEKTNKYSVIGRQSPFGISLKYFSATTKVDDEDKYLHEGSKFDATMTDARFTKQEIEQMVESADKHINKSQPCDMVRSNCYSNSTYMMAEALNILANRDNPPSQAAVQSIVKSIDEASKHHFSLGVRNNGVVHDKVTEAFESVRDYCDTYHQGIIDGYIDRRSDRYDDMMQDLFRP